MAESLVESNETVVKNEDDNQSTILDKETGIDSEKDKLSKSGNDSATCENNLKDGIAESNVVCAPEDIEGKENEDKEQTSGDLKKEEPNVNLDQDESKELKDDSTTKTAAAASSEVATISNDAKDKESGEQTQQQENKDSSKDKVNIENKSTEENVERENAEATHQDTISAGEKLDDQKETHDVKVSNDDETDESKGVEKNALQDVDNDVDKDSENTKNLGTGVEAITNENSDTISTTIEERTTTIPDDKSHEDEVTTKEEENRVDDKDGEKPTKITNEPDDDDTIHDSMGTAKVEDHSDSAENASQNKEESEVVEGTNTQEDSSKPNISPTSTDETVGAAPENTEGEQNLSKDNGDDKYVSSNDNEKCVENNDKTEVPISEEPSGDGTTTGTERSVEDSDKTEVPVSEEPNGDGTGTRTERSVEDNDKTEVPVSEEPSRDGTTTGTERSVEESDKTEVPVSEEPSGDGTTTGTERSGEDNKTEVPVSEELSGDGTTTGTERSVEESDKTEVPVSEEPSGDGTTAGTERSGEDSDKTEVPVSEELSGDGTTTGTERSVEDSDKTEVPVSEEPRGDGNFENQESQDNGKLDESSDKTIIDDSAKTETTTALDDNKTPTAITEQNGEKDIDLQDLTNDSDKVLSPESQDNTVETGLMGESLNFNDEGIKTTQDSGTPVKQFNDEGEGTKTTQDSSEDSGAPMSQLDEQKGVESHQIDQNIEYEGKVTSKSDLNVANDNKDVRGSEDKDGEKEAAIMEVPENKDPDEETVVTETSEDKHREEDGNIGVSEGKNEWDDEGVIGVDKDKSIQNVGESENEVLETLKQSKDENIACEKSTVATSTTESAPTEQPRQSSQEKIPKEKKSTFGDPIVILGASIETKQETRAEPKRMKSENKCDVSATKTQAPTPATEVSQNTKQSEVIEKLADSAENKNEENRNKEEDFVMIEHKDAEMERTDESDQLLICQESKSEDDVGDRNDVREEEKPVEEGTSHVTTAAPVVAAEKPVIEVTAEFLELMEGFCMAASQEFPSDIIDFAARYFQRIHKRRIALRKYSIEVSDLALLSDVNWVGNI